jgi:hypothetical protein
MPDRKVAEWLMERNFPVTIELPDGKWCHSDEYYARLFGQLTDTKKGEPAED